MDLIDLELALEEIIPNFQFKTLKSGQIIILTGLEESEDGDLIDMPEDLDEDIFEEDDNPINDILK